MLTPILMPALSPTMEAGTLVKWLVAAGDAVRAGDPVAEIETDKAVMEVEAAEDGTVTRLLVAEGTEAVPVNTPIAELDTGEEGTDEPRTAPAAAPRPPQPKAPPRPPRRAPEPGRRILASPLARRLARERGIELETLAGSGPNGRIVNADLERAAPVTAPMAAPVRAEAAPAPAHGAAARDGGGTLTLWVTVPTDGLSLSLEKVNAALPEGPRIAAIHFILKAAALALRDHPEGNMVLEDGLRRRLDGTSIGIGLADGAPVLRDAAGMTLTGIANAMAAAPPGVAVLQMADIGALGIDAAEAPPVPPATACLAAGRLNPGTGLALSLTLDLRAHDAATGARLLGAIRYYLENPLRMLL